MEPETAEAIITALIERESPPVEEPETPRIGLHEFGKAAWHVLRPGEEFIDGEHIQVLCDHLEYATNTPNYNLAVMMPPACGKSIWTAVIWPAWVWGPRGWAAARFLFTTYSEQRGRDDAERCKNLIESEWYQKQWQVDLTSDAIAAFSNTAGGQRKTSGTGGLGTGEHPHFVVADDANKQTDSADVFQNAINWWKHQMSTRGIIASIGSRRVCIGQRLRMNDVPKACIDMGYDCVVLPMWAWEPPTEQQIQAKEWFPGPTRATGWVDSREPGKLLWPEGIPEESARATELILGPVQAAAQLQQRPIRIAVNGMFPREAVVNRMMDRENIPWGEITRMGRYWDKAGGTSPSADRSAGVAMGLWLKPAIYVGGKPEKRLIVLDVVTGRYNPFTRNQIMAATAEMDRQLYGPKFELWVEKEKRGGAGIESAEITQRELVEYSVRLDEPDVAKGVRAGPFSSMWHGGKVWIVVAAWNQTYLDELSMFEGEASDDPNVHDDCVDGSSGIANKLLNVGTSRAAAPTGGKSKK